MRSLATALILAVCVLDAQTKQKTGAIEQTPSADPGKPMGQDPVAIRAIMQASIRIQKESVRRQAGSAVRAAASAVPSNGSLSGADIAMSFYTAPWPKPLSQEVLLPSAVAACDPLADADVNSLVGNAAKTEGVSADLIRAVMKQESGFKPCAVSPKGAQGLMQLMPATADEFHIADPFNPEQNVGAGAKLLKQLLARYSGDVKLALSAYNAGSARVDQAGDVPGIPETQNYVSNILNSLPAPTVDSGDGEDTARVDAGTAASIKPAGGT